MREIIIKRKKRFAASLVSPSIVLDGAFVGIVKNGQSIHLTVDDNEHTLYTLLNTKESKVLRINPGTQDIVIQLKFNSWISLFNLIHEINENSQNPEMQSAVEVVDTSPTSPKSQTASYMCGIIVSALLFGLSNYIYSIGETSYIGFIIGTLLSIASGAVIIIGGFWFYVIPLPYIAIWKTGCLKPNQSTKRIVILSILSFILPALVLVALFTLRDMWI